VASSIADRMGIAKADILNPESDNAAVKLALAETHVIQETKSYLESQGVILSSFSSRARSDTTILVKNIPYGTTAEQIREMFEVHGELSRVVVPPAGTMAVVEFAHADEAAKAFRAVAYRRLGNSVIYLEKGPMGMFQETTDEADGAGNTRTLTSTAVKPITIAEQEGGAGVGEDEPALSAGTTLFVKNLAFSTTAERLTQVFRNLPGFSFARVQTKPDPKRPTVPAAEAPRLSMGYGFVGFKTGDDAKKAMKSMQGFVLDGHALHVKFAGRGTEDEPKDKLVAKSTSTKMIVKNVPFEATKKDIRELFGSVHIFFCTLDITLNSCYIAPTVISSPYVSQRSSTRVRVVSHSWSSLHATRQRTRMLHFGTRIYLGDILCLSGQKRLSRT
jgi:multiple RNA-binding domain-containing protein 1